MSSYSNPAIPIPSNPVFIDAVVADLQTYLGTNLSWLTHSFGRSYLKVTDQAGEEFREPAVYQGGSSGEMLSMYFNDNLQAQSFFEVGDQEVIDFEKNVLNWYEVELGLIFWVNLKKIDSVKSLTYYFAEDLKKDVRNLLSNDVPGLAVNRSRLGYKLEIESIEEGIDNIYSKYTFDQKTKQYFRYPYAGFKFNLLVTLQEDCTP